MQGSDQLHVPASLLPGKENEYLLGGIICVPEGRSEAAVEVRIFCLCRGSNLDLSVIQAVA